MHNRAHPCTPFNLLIHLLRIHFLRVGHTGAEAHVYTLEASFYGYSNSPTGLLKPFTQTDYVELGGFLVISIP